MTLFFIDLENNPNHDSEEIIMKRKKNRNKIKAKYLPREVNMNEDACEPNNHDFGFL